jgi:hypothetical protein
MEEEQRKRLVKQRAAAKGMLTRMQDFITTGTPDLHELQVRLNKLSNIHFKFETAQEELEANDELDHSQDTVSFEEQYYLVEAKFHELLHKTHGSDSSSEHGSNRLSESPHVARSHITLPSIELPSYDGTASKLLYFRDTFESLIVNNKTLLNVQKLHYLTSSLKGEAKQLISNLPITNDNFAVAWDLVTQRYNNVKLIATTHVNLLKPSGFFTDHRV